MEDRTERWIAICDIDNTVFWINVSPYEPLAHGDAGGVSFNVVCGVLFRSGHVPPPAGGPCEYPGDRNPACRLAAAKRSAIPGGLARSSSDFRA